MLLVVETVKYSRGPSQVTVNPYAKGLFTSVPVTSYIKSSIQQKITIHVKGKKKKKKQSQETKGPLDPDLGHKDVVIIRTRI